MADPVPSGTPLLNTADYGPIDNEYSWDQLHGPSGNILRNSNVAISPDWEHKYPLGSGPYNVVDQNGNILGTGFGVADRSFKSPGQPNFNTVEFWNLKAPAGQVHLVPAAGWQPTGYVADVSGTPSKTVPRETSLYGDFVSKHPEYDQGDQEKNLDFLHDNFFKAIPKDKFKTWALTPGGQDAIQAFMHKSREEKDAETPPIKKYRKKHPEEADTSDDDLSHKLYTQVQPRGSYAEFKERINPTSDVFTATRNAFWDNLTHQTAAATLRVPQNAFDFNKFLADHPILGLISPLGYAQGLVEKDLQSNNWTMQLLKYFNEEADKQVAQMSTAPEAMKPGAAKVGAVAGQRLGQLPAAFIQYPFKTAQDLQEASVNAGLLVADAFNKQHATGLDEIVHQQHLKKMLQGAGNLSVDTINAFLMNSPFGLAITGGLGALVNMGAEQFNRFMNGEPPQDLLTMLTDFVVDFGLWHLAGKRQAKPPRLPKAEAGSDLATPTLVPQIKARLEEAGTKAMTETGNTPVLEEVNKGLEALERGDLKAAKDAANRALLLADEKTKTKVAQGLADAVTGKDKDFLDHFYFGIHPKPVIDFLERIMPQVRKGIRAAGLTTEQVSGATAGAVTGTLVGGAPGAVLGGVIGGVVTSPGMIKRFSPALTEERPTAAQAAGEALTRMRRRQAIGIAKIAHELKLSDDWWYGDFALKHRRFWQNFDEDRLYGMIADFEHGKKTGDATADMLLDAYNKIQDHIHQWDNDHGIVHRHVAHYMFHLFKRTEDRDSFYENEGLFGGKASFTKERHFDDVLEARKNGFELKTVNPFELVQARWHVSLLDHAMLETLEKLEAGGEAYSNKTATEAVKSNPNFVQFSDVPDGQAYWIKRDKVPTLREAFARPGPFSETIKPYTDRLAAAKGLSLAFRLMGLYHGAHMVMGLVHGERFATLVDKIRNGNFRGSDIKEFWDMIGGEGTSRIMDYLYNKPGAEERLSNQDKSLIQYLDKAGLDPLKNAERDLEFFQSLARALPKKIRGKATKLDAGMMLGIEWTRQLTLQKGLFENIIPRMKIESLRQNIDTLFRANPELFKPERQRELDVAIRKFGIDIDHNFGERNMKTLFTPHWFKQVGISHLLAMSWDMAFLYSGAGAFYDLAHNTLHFDKIMEAARRGDSVHGRFLTHRVIYSASLASITAMMSGLMTYMFTGTQPEGEDWRWPRIGTDAYGRPKRLNTPFFITEWARLAHYIYQDGFIPGLGHMAVNKAQPVYSTIMNLIMNRDYYGRQIYDNNERVMNGKLETWGQMATRVLEEGGKYAFENGLTPIFVESTGIIPGVGTPVAGMDWKDKLLAAFGFNPAPPYASYSRVEAEIMKTYGQLKGHGSSELVAEIDDQRAKYRVALQNKDQAGMDHARKELLALGVSPKSIREIGKHGELTSAQRVFQNFERAQGGEQEGLRILMGMNKDELAQWWKYAPKKVREEYNRNVRSLHPQTQD